jgi:hypothetical protein
MSPSGTTPKRRNARGISEAGWTGCVIRLPATAARERDHDQARWGRFPAMVGRGRVRSFLVVLSFTNFVLSSDC